MEQVSFKSFGIKWGIVTSMFCVIASLLLYLMGIKYFAGFIRFTPSILYYIIFLVAALQWRKSLGGFISFKQVFFGLITASVIAAIIYSLFQMLLYGVIDTELSEAVKNYWKEWTFNMMDGKVSEDKIEETMKKMDDKDYGMSIKNFFLGLLIMIGVDTIVNLIISAIVKKKNPMDDVKPEFIVDK